jgi:hypothetical protein
MQHVRLVLQSAVCHATERGLWRGAKVGLLASSTYVTFSLVCLVSLDMITTQSIIENPRWSAIFIGAVIIFGLSIGVIPSVIVGSLTGWCVALGLYYLDLRSSRMIRALSATVCLALVVAGHAVLWFLYTVIDWSSVANGVSTTVEGLWLAYLYFIGVPSLIYIAIGAWHVKGLAFRRNSVIET